VHARWTIDGRRFKTTATRGGGAHIGSTSPLFLLLERVRAHLVQHHLRAAGGTRRGSVPSRGDAKKFATTPSCPRHPGDARSFSAPKTRSTWRRCVWPRDLIFNPASDQESEAGAIAAGVGGLARDTARVVHQKASARISPAILAALRPMMRAVVPQRPQRWGFGSARTCTARPARRVRHRDASRIRMAGYGYRGEWRSE